MEQNSCTTSDQSHVNSDIIPSVANSEYLEALDVYEETCHALTTMEY